MKLIKALKEEADSAQDKINKLSWFIEDSHIFRDYSDVQKALTATQLNVLIAYKHILLERVHYLEKENNETDR